MAKNKTLVSVADLLNFIRDEKSYADVKLAIRQSGESQVTIERLLEIAERRFALLEEEKGH